mgnify:CR=1 FL=1
MAISMMKLGSSGEMKQPSHAEGMYRPKAISLLMLMLGLLFLILYLILLGVDTNELLRRISTADKRMIIVAIIMDTFYILFYAFAWFFIVRAVFKGVKLRDAVLIVLVGWFADMLVPAAFVTGELVRLYLLKRIYRVNYSKTAATIVVHRLLSALAFALFVGIGLMFLAETPLSSSEEFKHFSFIAVLAGITVVVGVLFIIQIENIAEGLGYFISKVGKSEYMRRILKKIKIEESLESFITSIALLKRHRVEVLLGFALLILQWGLGVSVPYVVFEALGYHMSYWKLAVAFPIYGLADNVPVGIPVNAGVLDAAMISMFILLGAPRDIAVGATFLTRAITVIYEAILTGLVTVTVVPRILGEKVPLPQEDRQRTWS